MLSGKSTEMLSLLMWSLLCWNYKVNKSTVEGSLPCPLFYFIQFQSSLPSTRWSNYFPLYLVFSETIKLILSTLGNKVIFYSRYFCFSTMHFSLVSSVFLEVTFQQPQLWPGHGPEHGQWRNKVKAMIVTKTLRLILMTISSCFQVSV